MKKLGIGLAIALVVVLGVVLIVPGFMDWNEYKGRIESAASDMTGREVKVAGDISLSLFPSAALSADNVTVANIEGGRAPHLLTLKSLDVRVAFFPLLRGNLKIRKFVLVDPVIALEVLPDGRVNWDFTDPDAEAAAAAPAPAEDSRRELSLDKFQISNGTVSFEDFAAGRKEVVRNIHADISLDSLQGPFVIDGRAKYQALPLGIRLETGTYRPGRKMPFSVDLSAFGDQVTAHFMGGLLPDPEKGELDGKLTFKARDLADVLKISSALSGESFVPLKDFQQALSLTAGVAAGPDRLALKDLTASLGDSRGQGEFSARLGERITLSGGLAVNSVDLDPILKFIAENRTETVSPAGKAAAATPPDYSFLDRLRGDMSFTLGALKYNNKIASQIAVRLEAKEDGIAVRDFAVTMPGGSDLAYDGVIRVTDGKPSMTGEVSLRSGNLRGLLDWVDVDAAQVPAGRLTRFSFASRVAMTEEMIQVYGIKGLLDTAKFSGGVSYALQDRLALGLDILVENLSFDSYLPARQDKAAAPLDLRAVLRPLADFDANYILTLTNATLNGTKVARAKMTGSLIGGQLRADSISLRDVAGLDLEASATGSGFAKEPVLALTFKASAEDPGRLQRAFRLDNGLNWKSLGAFSAAGSLKARLDQLDVDLNGRLGGSKLALKGLLRSATLKQLPEIGSYNFTVRADNPSLAAVVAQFDLPLDPPGGGDDRPVALSAKVKGIQNQFDLDGMVNIAGGSVAVLGRVQQPETTPAFDLSLDVESPELRDFVRGLGVDYRPSRSKLGALQVKSKLSGSANKYVLQNIAGDIGPVKLSGSGSLTLAADKGGKTRFDFTLKAGDIPVSQFMAAPAKTPQKPAKSFGQWSGEPIDLGPLKTLEGQAKISASSLRYEEYVFDSPQFTLLVRDGDLRVENFTGKLFGGDVKMAGRLGGDGVARLGLEVSLTRASLAKATKVAGGISPISGTLDLNGTFTGEGLSQKAIMSSLMGQGQVVASPGLIHGIDIPLLSKQIADVKTSQNFLQTLGVALGGGQTPYKGGTSSITVKNGFVNFSPLDLELDGATSAITLGINLFQWKMDFGGKFSLTEHPSAPPIGIRATGPIDRPVVKYQTQDIQKYVAGRIASNVLQNMVGGNETLKGIFGIKDKAGEDAPEAQTPGESPSAVPPPREEPAPQKPEDFGKKLLEKLFQKPQQKQDPAPDTPR